MGRVGREVYSFDTVQDQVYISDPPKCPLQTVEMRTRKWILDKVGREVFADRDVDQILH